jgi:formate hydrogenlyase subunit 3/multisubunit Na+/H+ antiporter MnhD subunit
MNDGLNIFLMLIGAFTIVAAAMMALVQGNVKKLLGYSTVSQVGYMVLGIGTGNPVGIAGGIFHMFNHATYKSCQFFASGNVEYRTRTSQLNELGGLAKAMPLTYISALIASLSISGVPPFNGFVSKWMVYQGLIEQLQVNNYGLRIITVLCLSAAMFGSGLTLAVFMKFIHATFLGQQSNKITGQEKTEVSWKMWLPCLVLAVICVVFGVFAYQVPLKYIIFPAVKGVTFIGTWYAGLSTLLIIIGLVLGIFIFKLKAIKPVLRDDGVFVGGETSGLKDLPVTGAEFYNTVEDFGILRSIYKKAESGIFDIYEQGKFIVFGIGKFLQYLHNGVMSTYLVWVLLGMMGLFFVLAR